MAFFEYSWLRQRVDGFFLAHSIPPPSLTTLVSASALWPLSAFFMNFAILDLSDYWRHRLSHTYGWWYGVHSVHHAEDQMTFWSDERSHVLEDTITYIWLIMVGLLIGVPSFSSHLSFSDSDLWGAWRIPTRASAMDGWRPRLYIAKISPNASRIEAAGRRSCNFGTALSWWDILFGTAKFHDTTVETGDAGAEAAMVTGSWGE